MNYYRLGTKKLFQKKFFLRGLSLFFAASFWYFRGGTVKFIYAYRDLTINVSPPATSPVYTPGLDCMRCV